ncbi:MAG: DinB family protein [Chloroflexota bacterium]
MDAKPVILSQYYAALEMLRQAIAKCPDALWDDPHDKNRFWHVAYHALFYTHLYVSVSEGAFTTWAQHRQEYQFLGTVPWPPHDPPRIGEPYRKEQLLDYVEVCRQQVRAQLALLDLDSASSGFYWLPFGKLELQFYNIRHLQQHTGELMERLGARAGIDVDWVGSKGD